MKKALLLVISILFSFSIIIAQSITSKLGGNDNTVTYDVTDSNDKVLFSIQGDGGVNIGIYPNNGSLDVNGNVTANSFATPGPFYDYWLDPGTNGQVLSSAYNGTAIDWIDFPSQTDVRIVSSYPATLSAGERVISTNCGINPQPILNFSIPTSSSSSGKTIKIFVGCTDVTPSLHFSQPVKLGDGTTYSGDSFLEVSDIYEGDVTLVSDGIAWRGFGVVYGGEICFVAGTKITMADGSVKNIEDIKINDIVASYDFNTDTIVNKKVLKTFANPASKGLVEITFSNDVKNINTADHRYYVKDKGWSAVKPNKSDSEPEAIQLTVGDTCFVISDNSVAETTVSSIKKLPNKITNTYNLHVDDSQCYYANGILVHNLY